MRLQFILSEIGIGIRRNLSMTISVILVTAVSLFFLGVALLLQQQVELMKGYWYDRVQVSIFLCGQDSEAPSCAGGEVTQAQKEAILAELQSETLQPYVERVFYESKAEAFERAQEQFQDSSILENVTEDQMPESYRVKLRDPEQFSVVADVFAGRAGIEEVQDQRQLLERFFTVINRVQWMAFVTAGTMVVCAVLLIGVTIRLAAFTRRREVGIMKLVGASNVFIQLPFVMEQVVATLLGTLLASLGLWAFVELVVQGVIAENLPFVSSFVGSDFVLTLTPLLMLTGVLLAAVSSLVMLRRHLRV
ncbi:MAG TPA: permease-like cell division protein FtsX [Nocardioidaceae bacterium]|nr:permease-like cell division protein FtsX [Nocardioidaceae bacterium]